jgi:isocitrate lyase
LQEAEFAAVKGFTAVKHQREVGIATSTPSRRRSGRGSSTTALKGSTEDEQFFDKPKATLSVANA